MSTALSLTERRNDLTRQSILDAALELLSDPSTTVPDLTFLAVSRRAGMSQRTVFRYFPTRDAFLDAVAEAQRARMALPPAPTTLDELRAAPRALYTAFQAQRALVINGLHTELADRMREGQARARWTAIRKLVAAHAPRRSERDRELAATNIRFYLAASTWHYYRSHLGMSQDDTIACAELVIRQTLDGL
jgi:AcrR family transcriptional regulator